MTRREFVAATSSAVTAKAAQPSIRHVLPAATHQRFLVKVSFDTSLQSAPVLRVGNRKVRGVRTDTDGQFWMFDVNGLTAATTYQLQLFSQSWPLKTFPAPDASVERFRLLIYTCAGGHDAMKIEGAEQPYWVSVDQRRKLFRAALREQPDAMIAIGDHIYWDLRYGRGTGRLPIGQQSWARQIMGSDFERDVPVLGTANEARLKRAADRQIAELYGDLFRSTPVHFIQDDHDYFDNDEAIDTGISFPPDEFMTRLARATQHLYFPEHLPDAGRPAGLPGAGASDRAAGLSECFGTLRGGSLVELLLYDCRRFQTLKGPHATLIPDNVEAWLLRRMKESPAKHVVHVPSMPIAWSAGKWGEWYPDVLDHQGRLGVRNQKYFWQQGWKSQHDRLLAACSSMHRTPLFLSGDLHALAHGIIERNGKHDLRHNPVHSVLTGPISTGPKGWPSSARGTPPLVASELEVREELKPLEWNGFTLVDFKQDTCEFRMYRWKLGQPEAELDRLVPFHTFAVERR
jgi:phosphodiesterase/alkaline phosphatase D-like protein